LRTRPKISKYRQQFNTQTTKIAGITK